MLKGSQYSKLVLKRETVMIAGNHVFVFVDPHFLDLLPVETSQSEKEPSGTPHLRIFSLYGLILGEHSELSLVFRSSELLKSSDLLLPSLALVEQRSAFSHLVSYLPSVNKL
jgi:hypothetical protein